MGKFDSVRCPTKLFRHLLLDVGHGDAQQRSDFKLVS